MYENITPGAVNGLVRRAFGSQFSGDFERGILVLDSDYPYMRSIDGKLGTITKDTSHGGDAKTVGSFEKEDGSHLVIYGTLFGSYERKANTFARLYQEKFGKRVKIERVPFSIVSSSKLF